MTPRGDLIARLDYWEGVLRSATPGPWVASAPGSDWYVRAGDGRIFQIGDALYHPENGSNAALIVAMRAMMEPALAVAREDLKEHRPTDYPKYAGFDTCWACAGDTAIADCPVIQKWLGIVPEALK